MASQPSTLTSSGSFDSIEDFQSGVNITDTNQHENDHHMEIAPSSSSHGSQARSTVLHTPNYVSDRVEVDRTQEESNNDNEKEGGKSLHPLQMYDINTLKKYYHLPMLKAARQLGVGLTIFKKICRVNNIRWPSRQIISLTKSIQSVEMAASNPALYPFERDKYMRMSRKLRHAIDLIVEDPNTVISEELFNMNASSDTNITVEEANALPPMINDVQAIIDASIASTEVDTSSSEVKTKQKTIDKKTKTDVDQDAIFDKIINFGESKVDFSLLPDEERVPEQPDFYFLTPIHLIPLEIQKNRKLKRILPMVDPDVSHEMIMDLDPSNLFSDVLKGKVNSYPGLPIMPSASNY